VGLEAARQQLGEFIGTIKATEPNLPLFLGGFSQGAMLACDLVLASEVGCVAGLFMLSASRLAAADWALKRDQLRGLRVLISHGVADKDLALSAGIALREFHTDSGARVTWVQFNDGHEIPLVVWRALRTFLTQNPG
jgi:phospholipase/carboxylesterase